MDLETIKFGLGIAAVGLIAIFISFAIYWKMGETALNKVREKRQQM
jgi:hypothetical protein